ncbi:hypothetical protein BDA96_03G174800 [Sorghum bicolor]|uniref:NAD-dependent epimerase/dehydratase domain-containing protein n=2 Tax=Sorghum bicolor TaxID=4558 RepID=C5XKN3_SORBI|nr:hypothetical protein SORBI_3003G166500 [Sorghum bicolor]KAG0537747.1 hypothetical protein BDA96_03G174800 [Sorghum bicolor]
MAMRSAVARLIRSSSASPSRLSSSSILLKSGNAFFSNATPSDQKHIEESFNATPSDRKHIEEPFEVKEAEPVNASKSSPEKLLVLGGSGFVGSHVCKEALDKGLVVSSLSRSGKPSLNEPWADKVIWNQGDLLEPASLKDAMDNVSAVLNKKVGALSCPRRLQSHARALCCIPIPSSVTLHRRSLAAGHRQRASASAWTHITASRRPRCVIACLYVRAPPTQQRCPHPAIPHGRLLQFPVVIQQQPLVSCVGGFGSNSFMYKINGTANINAIRTAAEKGVKRFVYVSAADFGLLNYLLQGYYEGKRASEAELLSKFTYGGVILRPGFIHGTRRVGSVKIPLGLVGSPMQMVLQNAKLLTRLPLIGPLLTPPVSVASVGKVAVRAATDPVFPPGIVDVYGIMRYSEQN